MRLWLYNVEYPSDFLGLIDGPKRRKRGQSLTHIIFVTPNSLVFWEGHDVENLVEFELIGAFDDLHIGQARVLEMTFENYRAFD